MKRIMVANPKGGCGKTTLATQLASYYADQGAEVVLADYDHQQSASDWLKARPQACAPITSFSGYGNVAVATEPVVSRESDTVLIRDLPAACSVKDIQNLLESGDYLIIPILPSPTDIKAGVRFLMELNREGVVGSGISIGLVANRVRANTTYFKVLCRFLSQLNMPLVASIRDTQNYIRAMDNGVSIFDLPKSRVAGDIAQWQDLLEWLSE